MNFQEISYSTDMEAGIKAEKFHGSSLFNKELSAQIISNERGIKHEYFDELQYIVQMEKIDVKNEDHKSDHSTNMHSHDLVQNSYYFSKPLEEHLSSKDSIKCETTVCKTEDYKSSDELQESNFNEGKIKDEYFDEAEYITQEEFDIKYEDQEEDHPTNMNEVTTTDKRDEKYFCNNCNYKTRWKKCLMRHMLSHKGGTSTLFCNQCSYVTVSDKRLNKHLETHSACTCIFCKKHFKKRLYLDSHYIFKHPNKSEEWGNIITYKINECPRCDYKTVRLGDFKKHLASHEFLTYKFKCSECGFKCVERTIFSEHLRIHANQRNFLCEGCGKRFKCRINLDSHIVSQHSNNELLMAPLRLHGQFPLVCTECNKMFSRKYQLDGHIISQHSRNQILMNSVTNKVLQCSSCGYKTVIKSHLNHHLVRCKCNTTQSTSFIYTCDVCKYKCVRKDRFRAHLRIHSGQLPFACTECDKAFNKKVQLDGHIVSRHSNDEQLMSSVTYKVYQCDSCDYKTVRRVTLEQHVMRCKINRTAAERKCNVCGYMCANMYTLTRHLHCHTNRRPFVCVECDKIFKQKVHLDSHIVSRHSDDQRLMNSVTSKVHHCNKCNYTTVLKIKLTCHLKSCRVSCPTVNHTF